MTKSLNDPGVHDLGSPAPPNAVVVDLADFSTVLPTAAVLVTNGGWGGVLAGLSAGVPLVLAPGGLRTSRTSPPGWPRPAPV